MCERNVVVIYVICSVRYEVYCSFRFSKKEAFVSTYNHDINIGINGLINLLTYFALLTFIWLAGD